MKRPPCQFHWHYVLAALFRVVVIEIAGIYRDRGESLFLSIDDVADVDELVVPGIQRSKMAVGDLHDVWDDAAGDRGNLLLAERREGNDAQIDLVAARLLIVSDQPLE